MRLFYAALVSICWLFFSNSAFASRHVKTKGRIARALHTPTRILKSARYVFWGDKSFKELGLNPKNIRRQKVENAASMLVSEHGAKSFHLIDFLESPIPSNLVLTNQDFIVTVTALDDIILETGSEPKILHKQDRRGFEISRFVPKFSLFQVGEFSSSTTNTELTIYNPRQDKTVTYPIRVFPKNP